MTRTSTSLALPVLLLVAAAARSDDWPQWLGPQRDATWRETGIVRKFPDGGPPIVWKQAIRGGYAGPAVANGKVYVPDYVTNADPKKESFERIASSGKERVLCFDAADGKPLWEHAYDVKYNVSYPAGPRATPTVHDGKVYALGTEGDFFCLDADKGNVIWSKNFKKDYKATTPIWGFCGHPLIDGNKVITIVGGEGSVVVAFDKDTGKEMWKALSAKEPGYSSPTLIEAGGVKQLLVWHAEALVSLDPENGKTYWTVPLEPAYGMAIMAPRKSGDYLFASGNGNKSVLLKLASDKPAVTEVWRGKKTNSISSINSPPYLENGIIYGADQPGFLRAVNMKDAEQVWSSSLPITGKEDKGAGSGTVFLVKNGDHYFLFSETGHLIIAKLTPTGYEEISRAKVIDPSGTAFGRSVVWTHPAYANKHAYIRNDKELICVDLADKTK